MDERYIQPEIHKIWRLENKLKLWQLTELAALEAKVVKRLISSEDFKTISEIFENTPIDVDRFKQLDKELNHDLNAFLAERGEHLPENLRRLLHENMTSHDTQEPAFARMQIRSMEVVLRCYYDLEKILIKLAEKYRFTIMLSRTHGQWAELQSFGKRVLTWLRDLRLDKENIDNAFRFLRFSKMSGAVGNYIGIGPEIEEEVLKSLRFEPYYGATQIMPREAFFPLATSLYQLVSTIDKIALAIRLGARSGRPIHKEPFGKKQMGSSAMPHKENTISTEQLEGMKRLARGYAGMAGDNMGTWEERAIEQSCVERVAWPDLYHVTIRSLRVITIVLDGLRVYPDNMLKEIVESCGCYAISEAKEFLKKKIVEAGLTAEEGYRIVQLAAFNAFKPAPRWKTIREMEFSDLKRADTLLSYAEKLSTDSREASIQVLIPRGLLDVHESLAADIRQVIKWNNVLEEIFSDEKVLKEWNRIFEPSYLLRNEHKLYKEILGE